MRTSKPFSTISYNTKEFLEEKMNGYVQRGVISFWCAVKHFAEEDETKEHFHLFVVPDGRVDTQQITNDMKEIDLSDPLKKPLGVMPWRSSKFGDWYMYSSHNTAYLTSKGQKRKYHYSQGDFLSSDSDYLNELIHTIDLSKINKIQIVIDAIEHNESITDLLMKGQIPIMQIGAFQTAFEMVSASIREQKGTVRNGRDNHEQESEARKARREAENRKEMAESWLTEYHYQNRFKYDKETGVIEDTEESDDCYDDEK